MQVTVRGLRVTQASLMVLLKHSGWSAACFGKAASFRFRPEKHPKWFCSIRLKA